ncbi:carbon-nitrogen hydrolase family protein [Rhodococcus sp. G-MC3]|uniref:carbon-nitrogen hydrolase family protein n=1 Tax=Rhodococcus sp. G-MC3 TaxID=3046209 RepID=UPI0024B9D413|nr:carbon-nitrogen hydrolase family protein [Rhodococcus sp. G-MC3]MDJ0395825.1 carbon-nitrogen hydrolase family protein [Rhodococcus sp. G-MC3]
MRLSVLQGPQSGTEVAQNLSAIGAAAEQAAASGAVMMVTPEMSATGYNIAELTALRAESADGPMFDAIAAIARRTGVAVVYGYPERVGDDVYNSVQVVDSDGCSAANYRKSHLFGSVDRGHFRPGEELVVQFDIAGIRSGLLTCYDVEFPEAVRAHADAGTQLLIVPTGLMRPFELVARQVVPTRAYESQMFLAYVNRCGSEGEFDYCGLTCVLAPDGTELARAGAGEELLTVDIDIDELVRSRSFNTHLDDRRRDLYKKQELTR